MPRSRGAANGLAPLLSTCYSTVTARVKRTAARVMKDGWRG